MKAEQRELIENIIKQHPLYQGHENLMERFCAEVYKKSYLLLDSVSNIDSLKNYLVKVADTSITSVVASLPQADVTDIIPLKRGAAADFGMPRPDNSLKEIKKSISNDSIVSLHRQQNTTPASQPQIQDVYASLIDPDEFFSDKNTNPALAENILEIIDTLDLGNPGKKYGEIFAMRYVQNLHQSVIARRLKLSQADLSKRFCELVKLVKQQLD